MASSDMPPPDLPKKKSNSKKPRKDEESSLNSLVDAKPEKKSKKKLRVVADATAEESAERVEEKEKKKKRKREAEGASGDDGDVEDVGKKSKKRPKRTKESTPDGAVATTPDAPTKKRKNKTSFLDPNEDATLSDQSQKCLAYAFLQFYRPSKWKFNKARQNWLIRNVWSNEMVPEAHLPLVLGYLEKVQGGVRENLLKSCRAALEPPKLEERPAKSTESTAEPTVPLTVNLPPTAETKLPSDAEIIKKTRAQVLIDRLTSEADA